MEPNALSKKARNLVDESTERAQRSLEEVRASAKDIAARGKAAIRSNMARTREALSDASGRTSNYVRAQPLKSLLWATAAGAAIALLVAALGKHRAGRAGRH